MLEVLFSWVIISVASTLFGSMLIWVFYRNENALHTLDVYIIAGLLGINIYAEIFSLFYKVGAKACFILFVIGFICGGIIIYKLWKREGKRFRNIRNCFRGGYWQYLISFFCIVAVAIWTVAAPQHYDTPLYHIQAVRWIEEYGIVPGLGNLHNRFAYNSAFMPLQALFSLRWLIDNSLHTLNGFICCIFLVYAICSNSLLKREELQTSDFLKFAVIIYICSNREYISSLSSDILAMLLVLYIFVKWCEFFEKGIEGALPYSFLCLIAVWAITVKLSTVVCILLVLYPAVLLIKRREYKQIMLHLAAGLVICVPWLMRNVLISGYLIYPYAGIDFFSFDWKMLPSVLDYDRMEICVWGRGTKDVALYHQPISQWITIWYQSQNKYGQWLVVTGAISCLVLIGICILKLCRKHIKEVWLYVVALAGCVMWLFSAPLLRYGIVYLLLPACFVLGQYYKRNKFFVLTISLLVTIPLVCALYAEIVNIKVTSIIAQERYPYYETYTEKLDEADIYLPTNSNCWVGDDVFPSTPYPHVLDRIELRGESLKSGFRIKESCRGMRLRQDGYEWLD